MYFRCKVWKGSSPRKKFLFGHLECFFTVSKSAEREIFLIVINDRRDNKHGSQNVQIFRTAANYIENYMDEKYGGIGTTFFDICEYS